MLPRFCSRWFVACSVAARPRRSKRALGDRDVDFLSLKVNGRGEALVSYRRTDGARRDVLISGRRERTRSGRGAATGEVRATTTAAVGGSHGTAEYARSFEDTCRAYDGPSSSCSSPRCKAPDGSYWALQRWQRLAPMRGFAPFLPEQDAYELHVSHWSGPLPVLEVSPNWTYGGTLQGLFGRLTYRGDAVYGFRTPSATRSDPYARFVYIDTFNSVYGPGWKRDTGIVTHQRNGAFCYSFVAQAPPPGYPSREPRGPGNGERHRVTGDGPGSDAGGASGRARACSATAPPRTGCSTSVFDRLVGPDDKVCTRER